MCTSVFVGGGIGQVDCNAQEYLESHYVWMEDEPRIYLELGLKIPEWSFLGGIGGGGDEGNASRGYVWSW